MLFREGFEIRFPVEYDDDLIQFEIEHKGYYWAELLDKRNNNKYSISFYDKGRLLQDITDTLSKDALFFESNMVIIKKVTKDEMINAIIKLIDDNLVVHLAK